MHEDILKKYLPLERVKSLKVLDDVEMGGPDYGFYLLGNDSASHVLAEVPYFYVSSVVPEIGHLFPVNVLGWYRPLEDPGDVEMNLLSPDFFSSKNGGREKRNMFDDISTKQNGQTYVLLSVIPK